MVSKSKVTTPWIVALVIATSDDGLSSSLLFAADEPPQTPAAAQPADDDRWQFNVAPYLWGASLSGDVKIGRVEADVGYRALHQKYEDGDFKWDVTQHGAIT